MKQVLQNFKDGELRMEDVAAPTLQDGGILVQNHYSCVSAGTEKAVIDLAKKNLLGKARERPDLAKKVVNKAKNDGILSTYQSVMSRLEEPSPLGYSCCGEVIAVADDVTEFSVGDMVACGGADYANHAEVVYVPQNLAVKVPDGVRPQDGAFVTLGAIAMQGIRRADLSPGERVGVIGLGLIGQLTTQILDAYGFPVLGIDIDPGQVEKGIQNGVTEGAVIGQDDVESMASKFSDGHGLDAVIITASTDSNQPVEMAGEIAREQGRISVVGLVGTDVPRNLYYDKELDFLISRSYGPGRYDKTYEEKGLSYPIEYVRWTETRNMAEFLRLIGDGRVELEPIITHRFGFDEALDAYDLILENPNDEDFTGVLLEYDETRMHEQTKQHRSSLASKRRVDSDVLNVGLVGGGTFAKGTLLPTIEDIDGLNIHAVATATGKSAADIAKKYDCAYSTTDYLELVDDNNVDLVVIATRHNLHAEMAVTALNADKDVHVEKPLAISKQGLRDVITAEDDSNGRLMVGYNRRFSPITRELIEVFENVSPIMINYRVNAGEVDPDHWIHDPEVGGGRIVGEVCHFIDFIQYATDSSINNSSVSKVSSKGDSSGCDNLSVNLQMSDGSVGSIFYTSEGDQSLAKERIEVFGGGTTKVINNYKTGVFSIKQKKGHREEFEAFAKCIREGTSSPIHIDEIAESTRVAIELRDDSS